MATDTPVMHIHCYAEPGERQHTQTAGCWCHAFKLTLDDGTVVFDHDGDVRPSVLAMPPLLLGIERYLESSPVQYGVTAHTRGKRSHWHWRWS